MNINLTEEVLNEFNANFKDSEHAFDRVCEKLGSGTTVSIGKSLLLSIVLAPLGFMGISMSNNKKAEFKAEKLADILYSDSRYVSYINRLDTLVDEWNASKANRTAVLKSDIKETFKRTINYGRSVLKDHKKELAELWKENKKYLKEDMEDVMEDILKSPDDLEKVEEPSEDSAAAVAETPTEEKDCSDCDLIGYLKITSQNLKTLHRHLVGGNWFGDHEKLAEYYEYIDEMEDAVVEISIALGKECCDMSIADAAEKFAVLSGDKKYKADEAFTLTKIYFEKLQRLVEGFKSENPDLPSGVVSKLDEYSYWLFLESKFKLSALLSDVNFDDNLLESLRANIKR